MTGATRENPLGAEALPTPPDLAGTYASEKLRLTLRHEGGEYAGDIRMGDRTFPLKARRAGDKLEGSFDDNGNSFAITITGDGAPVLWLETGGAKHELKRDGPPHTAAEPARGWRTCGGWYRLLRLHRTEDTWRRAGGLLTADWAGARSYRAQAARRVRTGGPCAAQCTI